MKNREYLYGVGGVILTYLLMFKPKNEEEKGGDASARRGDGFGEEGEGVDLLTPTAVESRQTNINIDLKDKERTDDIKPTKRPLSRPMSRPTGGVTPTPKKRPLVGRDKFGDPVSIRRPRPTGGVTPKAPTLPPPPRGGRPTGGVTPKPIEKRPLSRPQPKPNLSVKGLKSRVGIVKQSGRKDRIIRPLGRGFDGEGYDFMGRELEDTFMLDY